jgi:hypothetical protein
MILGQRWGYCDIEAGEKRDGGEEDVQGPEWGVCGREYLYECGS